jgi:tRNA-2-methylthio-N6-dimethylallyladenosine synthase
VHEVLIEGVSKRSAEHLYGRNTQNAVVIVPRMHAGAELLPGTFIRARITSSTSGSLQGEVLDVINEPLVVA